MLSPARPSPDERGKRLLQTQVEQVLDQASIPLATSAAHQPPLYWGTTVATRATLYLWLAEEPQTTGDVLPAQLNSGLWRRYACAPELCPLLHCSDAETMATSDTVKETRR